MENGALPVYGNGRRWSSKVSGIEGVATKMGEAILHFHPSILCGLTHNL
jgi:hypothetical protein